MLNRVLNSIRCNRKSIWQLNSFGHLSRQYSSYASSKPYNPEDKVDFEVSTDPEEWKYVTRLIPESFIPEPVVKDQYPSGWKPQSSSSVKGNYFVRRSRNHMVPVYLNISLRGLRKLTTVRHVLGDIWQFSADLKNYIEEKVNHEVGMKVDEVACKIILRGDYVFYAEQFILKKGL